jgi:hypothetical protein
MTATTNRTWLDQRAARRAGLKEARTALVAAEQRLGYARSTWGAIMAREWLGETGLSIKSAALDREVAGLEADVRRLAVVVDGLTAGST